MAQQVSVFTKAPNFLKFFVFACLLSANNAGYAEGIANFASYLDAASATRAATALHAQLGTEILTSEATVNGQRYLRLQSAVLDDWDARGLVKRAKTAGYDAWFQSVSAPLGGQAASEPASAAAPASGRSANSVTTTPVMLTNANPKLAAVLPEGPLLGELYPPRKPRNQ